MTLAEGVRRWLRGPTRPRRVEPSEAYARWAPVYGEPPTPLHAIEAGVVEALLPAPEGRRALDVGAGRGRIARRLRSGGARSVVAVDASLPMLRAAAGLDAHRVAADAAALPLRPGGFDLVTCCLVLGHLEDPLPALAAMAAQLAPGGALLLTLFHPDAARRGWSRTFRDPRTGELLEVRHHVHDLEALRRALADRGLRVEAEREAAHEGVRVVYGLRAARTAE